MEAWKRKDLKERRKKEGGSQTRLGNAPSLARGWKKEKVTKDGGGQGKSYVGNKNN